MFYDARKLLLLKARPGYYEGDLPDIEMETIDSLEELVKLALEVSGFDRKRLLDILLKDKELTRSLDAMGYRNVKKLKDVNERVVSEKRFFVWNPADKYFHSRSMAEIDLTDMTAHNVDSLVPSTAVLLQSVDKKSLKSISPEAYEKYLKKKKAVAARSKAARAAAKKRKEKALQKKLEKAKKLLEDHGQ